MNQGKEQIEDLRKHFLSKLECDGPDIFHQADVSRVKSDDEYLRRFLMHHDWDQNMAFNMLWETCEWRKKYGTNDISEKNVNRNILESGCVFPHGKDKDGKTLLIFKYKKLVKGTYDFEEQKRCLVYWMERLQRQENGEMISLFFDLDGAGLVNMDLEYTKYIIALFKNYYPYFLNYILIYEMAWVLNAVFKIIKTQLPAKAVEKMKFVTKSNLKECVDPEYALKSWGGSNDYVFHFEPEQKALVSSTSVNSDEMRKKVHFADGSYKHLQSNSPKNESGLDDNSSPLSTLAVGLSVTPLDVMLFTQEGNEVMSSIALKNENSQNVSFKVKTTSPGKFIVRPSTGVLKPGANTTVNIILLPGYVLQALQKDKFLIMSLPIEQSDMSQREISDLWKQVSHKEIHQHKLRCAISQTANNELNSKIDTFDNHSIDDQKALYKLSSEIVKLNTYVISLREEMRRLKQQQRIVISAVFFLICLIFYFMYTDNTKSSREICWADGRGH